MGNAPPKGAVSVDQPSPEQALCALSLALESKDKTIKEKEDENQCLLDLCSELRAEIDEKEVEIDEKDDELSALRFTLAGKDKTIKEKEAKNQRELCSLRFNLARLSNLCTKLRGACDEKDAKIEAKDEEIQSLRRAEIAIKVTTTLGALLIISWTAGHFVDMNALLA